MAFSFQETPESRAQSYSADSDEITLIYKSVGEQNDATVRSYAVTGSPATVTGLTGTLYRKSIDLRPDGFQQYFVEVRYGRLTSNSLPVSSYTFNFDTTGGTTNITSAKEHINSYPTASTPPNHHGSINVRPDGTVDGAEIVIPKLRLTFNFNFPSGVITAAYMKSVAAITGTTNQYRFLGFEPGELLFMGASGGDGSNTEMTVGFQFEASANATGFSSGGISSISKKGHEYLWHEFNDEVDSGKAATRPKYVHIERVYDSADFQSVFGWNIFTG